MGEDHDASSLNKSQNHLQFQTADDLLRLRASEKEQWPFLGYPGPGTGPDGRTEYSLYSPRDLDRITNSRCADLVNLGFVPKMGSETGVVAILGFSDLEYLINLLALSRLGYAVLILSPRLSLDAYSSLLDATKCDTVMALGSHLLTIRKLQKQKPLTCLSGNFDLERKNSTSSRLSVDRDYHNPHPPSGISERISFILHSSGSTGLPKPIFWTHKSSLDSFSVSSDLRGFSTVPLYHTHGFGVLYRTLWGRGTLYMVDPTKALTSASLISALEAVQPEIFYSVPYGLKLVADSERGVRVLRKCEKVSSAGSACPDELGDYLVAEGVNVYSFYGSTELGPVMTSSGIRGDKAWNYLRMLPAVKPYILMKPVDDKTYELVALDGLPAKVATNSDDPPRSFYSKDLFMPHPSIPDVWKYLGRKDDRITLVNGEKVLPLPIEGRIRKEPLVREAVVFGTGREYPGLLLFRSADAKCLSDEEFLSRVWPVIEDANSRAESFSQIARDMVCCLPHDIEFPRTDKSTVIRAQVYKAFAGVIDRAYERAGGAIDPRNHTPQSFTPDELRRFLRAAFENMGITLDDDGQDFFAAGLDSLQAMQVSRFIKNHVRLGDNSAKIDQNLIFEMQNIRELTDSLLKLQSGLHINGERRNEDKTFGLIAKYSTFHSHEPRGSTEETGHVLLTGATGSLGGHVLKLLLADECVHRVYCLVRSTSASSSAVDRVVKSLHQAGGEISPAMREKIVVLKSDMSREDLGLDAWILDSLKDSLNLIVHCAWAVNFNVPVQTFEDQHIRGLHNLLNLSLSVRRAKPARLVFCSSISVAMNSPAGTVIPEALSIDLGCVQDTGYAQSKFVAEHIVSEASGQGADCIILRVGQIVGDSVSGRWNAQEAVPLMIRSAGPLGCLPALNESCNWLPVDVVARTVLDISRTTTPQLVYNIVHPKTFSWTQDLLPALRSAGLTFDVVAPVEWIRRLRESEVDAERNPAVRLISFFSKKYGAVDGKKLDGGVGIRFSNEQAQRESETLRRAPDIISGGYIAKFLKAWGTI